MARHPNSLAALAQINAARAERRAWQEYDDMAEFYAFNNKTGHEPLPPRHRSILPRTYELINADREAFARRVRECAYAQAMEATMELTHPEEANNG